MVLRAHPGPALIHMSVLCSLPWALCGHVSVVLPQAWLQQHLHMLTTLVLLPDCVCCIAV